MWFFENRFNKRDTAPSPEVPPVIPTNPEPIQEVQQVSPMPAPVMDINVSIENAFQDVVQ